MEEEELQQSAPETVVETPAESDAIVEAANAAGDEANAALLQQGIQPPDMAGALNDTVNNVSDQIAGAVQNIQDNPAVQNAAAAYGLTPQQTAPPEQDPNIISETGAAIAGGAADAVESVGSFAELTGDTLKTGFNTLFGRPIDETQNPFSQYYQHQDAGWLDIPDYIVPENKTALGNLARGLVEFGLLTAATGGVGSGAVGGARVGIRVAATARAAGIGVRGTRFIRFIPKVAAEGAVAELVSSAGEDANLLNLIDDTTPWMSPWAKNVIGVNALKVNPDDNPWLARIKSVAVGSGINLVGYGISAYAKGMWKAKQARKQGLSIDEANEAGNDILQKELQRELELDEKAATEKAIDQYSQGYGVSHADPRDEYLRTYLSEEEYARYHSPEAAGRLDDGLGKTELNDLADARGAEAGDVWDLKGKHSTKQLELFRQERADPWVNPRKFGDSNRAMFRPEGPKPTIANIRESIEDLKTGGAGRSYKSVFTETALRQMSRGDANIRQYILEVAEDISKSAFKSLDNTLDYRQVQELIIRQASDMHQHLERGGDIAQELRNYFKNSKDNIVWTHNGNEVVTGTASQKAALQLVINTLGKQAEAIATGAVHSADDIPITRQVEQVFDAMKVAMIEHKKIGFMTGTELANQKNFVLSPNRAKQIGRKLEEITKEQNEYWENLHALNKKGRWHEMRDLMELNALSKGDVRSMEMVHDWFQAKLYGGDVGGGNITGRLRTELQSVFYNSILSSLKTPIDAITSTVMIGTSRPMMQYIGAAVTFNQKEMAIAAAGIDAIGKAYRESIDMAMHNWDLGLQRKAQSYSGRFDVQGDIAEWQALADKFSNYGSPQQQRAYGAINNLVNMNSSPWMKYSANAMGAGDAFTRTMLGRVSMRMKAAREAIYNQGVDLKDLPGIAKKTEENFRREIFKKDAYGKWVVHDKGANLAGDEATMTKALEGWPKAFEGIQKVPVMRAFFPFVRTGVNALDLTWQSSPLAFTHKKWKDLNKGLHLDDYGIKPEELAGEIAMMRGRLAVGSSITGMAFIATMAGQMTGDYPYDKEGRDLWKAAGIQPYSFKIGNTYVSYKELEPWNTIFSVAANMVQNGDTLGEAAIDNWQEKLAFMASAVLVDKSMLSGVKDLTEIFNPNRAEGALSRTFSKFARSHLPYAGLMGQLGEIMDGNAREAQNFMEMMWKRDAIAKNAVPPKYDILNKDRSGKKLNLAAESPIFRFLNAVSPIAVVPIANDPVKQALVDIHYNLPEMMSSYMGVQLNSLEKSQLMKYMSMDKKFRRHLEIIISSPSWQKEVQNYKDGGYREEKGYKLSHQLFYQQINAVFREAKAKAWQQVLINNPHLQANITERRVKQEQGRVGLPANSIESLQQFGY